MARKKIIYYFDKLKYMNKYNNIDNSICTWIFHYEMGNACKILSSFTETRLLILYHTHYVYIFFKLFCFTTITLTWLFKIDANKVLEEAFLQACFVFKIFSYSLFVTMYCPLHVVWISGIYLKGEGVSKWKSLFSFQERACFWRRIF